MKPITTFLLDNTRVIKKKIDVWEELENMNKMSTILAIKLKLFRSGSLLN
jgi:hypothetical protein